MHQEKANVIHTLVDAASKLLAVKHGNPAADTAANALLEKATALVNGESKTQCAEAPAPKAEGGTELPKRMLALVKTTEPVSPGSHLSLEEAMTFAGHIIEGRRVGDPCEVLVKRLRRAGYELLPV